MIIENDTSLLSLPNEILLYHIFIYLRSTDLLHAFGRLYHRRMNVLLYAHIRHLDFSNADTSVVSIDKWLSFLKNSILSLRINSDHLNDHLFSTFPKLIRLDLQMTTAYREISRMVVFTRIKVLSITLTSEQPERIEGLARRIWHSESCLENLSVSNCFILNRNDLFPTSSCTLMFNRNITHLSIDLAHICFATVLMPFVPALEHFEVRLHDDCTEPPTFTAEFLQRQTWPMKVKSLRFIAHDQYMNITSFCSFVKRFSLSLEHLSFYISVPERFFMRTKRPLQHHLLIHLPHLKRLDFCVHSGLINHSDIDRRQTFDSWTEIQVVSVFHIRGFHTRFTLPFSFDRLEHICNGFIDFHCNHYQNKINLSLPSIVMITINSPAKLSLTLFTLIREACSCLRQLRLKNYCRLTDDLVEDTQLTLPTVTHLYFDDIPCSIGFPILYRVVSLTPNLKYFTAKRHHITTINTMNNNFNLFAHIVRMTTIECCRHLRQYAD